MPIEEEFKKRLAKGEIMPHRALWSLNLLGEKEWSPGKPKFDASKYPLVSFVMAGEVITWVSDPEVVQDMFVAKNKFLTKTLENAKYFDIFFSNMFAMMPSNDLWKLHRKTCSPMFYKNKLAIMGKVFKEHLTIATQTWRKEIVNSGQTRILLSEEFERIYAHTINHICFG